MDKSSPTDTHKIVKDLMQAGFSEEQAEALVPYLARSDNEDDQEAATRHDLQILGVRLRNDLLISIGVLIITGILSLWYFGP
jgi:hypothetical protein